MKKLANNLLELWIVTRDRLTDSDIGTETHKNDLEYSLLNTDWILEKVRSSDVYAQCLYAAICNNEFQRQAVWSLLKGETWSCSWRYAGGIIADMREAGDYMDWYCSGGEGMVDEEIRADLFRLGWQVVE
jgi:hypothetical protein